MPLHPCRASVRRRPPFALLALLAVAACSPAPTPSAIAGTVVDATTQAALVGTSVVARADLGTIALTGYAPSRSYGSAASDEAFSMPLPGVRVAARIAGTATVVATAFTDEHGAVDLDPVPAGTYDVELSRAGFVPRLVEGVVAPAGGAADVGDLKLLPVAP